MGSETDQAFKRTSEVALIHETQVRSNLCEREGPLEQQGLGMPNARLENVLMGRDSRSPLKNRVKVMETQPSNTSKFGQGQRLMGMSMDVLNDRSYSVC